VVSSFSVIPLPAYSEPSQSARLDVYHTSTHDAGLKCAADGSLNIQDEKVCHLRTIAQICPAVSSQLRHISTIGSKLVKQQYLLHMSSQYGELPPING